MKKGEPKHESQSEEDHETPLHEKDHKDEWEREDDNEHEGTPKCPD
jgi:hypothetical protein